MDRKKISFYLENADYDKTNNKLNIILTLIRLKFKDKIYCIVENNANKTEKSIPLAKTWWNLFFIIDSYKLLINEIFNLSYLNPSSNITKSLIKNINNNLECNYNKIGDEINIFIFVSAIIEWYTKEYIESVIWKKYWLIELWETSTKIDKKWLEDMLFDELEVPKLLN